jgi:hypothetical protein
MAKRKKSSSKISSASTPVKFNEKKWQAECDARTLADAKVIMSDKSRLKAAAKEAGKMADCKMEEAKAMKSIAKKV